MRIGVADPLLLPKRVDPVDFLFRRAGAWAANQAAAGRGLDCRERRPVPEEEGPRGLAATLLGLAIDAPRLVERVETTTQWVELEDAAQYALEVAEEVLVVLPLAGPS